MDPNKMNIMNSKEIKWDSMSAFDTFDEFLDSQITELDLFYVQDIAIARKLVEYGLRGNGEIISKKEYTSRKAAIEKPKDNKTEGFDTRTKLGSFSTDSMEYHLAKREIANRKGILNTIVFVRILNARNKEISSYIDYAHRLETDDFSLIFESAKKFLPKISDLSYYDWSTGKTISNETRNYLTISNNQNGLLFKNKNSRIVLNLDPFVGLPELYNRTDVFCTGYLQVSFFDHFLI
jgi:hypothetical protein